MVNGMLKTQVESSFISMVGYEPENKNLTIEFKGGSLYSYSNVSRDVYMALMFAKSIGKAFHTIIKDNMAFDYQKIK